MARITIEEALEKFDNRFDMIVLAAHRARRLSKGLAEPMIDTKEKPTVTVLREIEAGLIDVETLREEITAIDYQENLLSEFSSLEAGTKAGMNRLSEEDDEDDEYDEEYDEEENEDKDESEDESKGESEDTEEKDAGDDNTETMNTVAASKEQEQTQEQTQEQEQEQEQEQNA